MDRVAHRSITPVFSILISSGPFFRDFSQWHESQSCVLFVLIFISPFLLTNNKGYWLSIAFDFSIGYIMDSRAGSCRPFNANNTVEWWAPENNVHEFTNRATIEYKTKINPSIVFLSSFFYPDVWWKQRFSFPNFYFFFFFLSSVFRKFGRTRDREKKNTMKMKEKAMKLRDIRRRRRKKQEPRQNNRTGNVESFKPISSGGREWDARARLYIREGGPRISIEGRMAFLYTCENRIVFCLRNVYVWTGALSHDSRKRILKKKTFVFRFFLLFLDQSITDILLLVDDYKTFGPFS